MENVIRVSVSEAARLFGLSPKTIRQAIKKQEIKYIVVSNRYKINFASLVTWSQKSVRRSNLLHRDGIGQYIHQWKIHNKKFSPSFELINRKSKNSA